MRSYSATRAERIRPNSNDISERIETYQIVYTCLNCRTQVFLRVPSQVPSYGTLLPSDVPRRIS